MTTEIDRKLDPFLFPIIEREVYHEDVQHSKHVPSQAYKAVVRKDTGELISIMNQTYKIVPNSEVIKPLLEQLHKLDTAWYVDSSHSYVQNNQMRLQVTFPELTFHDGKSDIALSLYLTNSADGSLAIKIYFGGLRSICRNGMVYGTILSKFYGKHTQGISLDNIKEQIENTYQSLPVIQHRIEQLQNTKVDKVLRQSIESKLGKKAYKYVEEQENEIKKAQNQWILYNLLTYHISHNLEQRMRAQYQLEVSKLFKL